MTGIIGFMAIFEMCGIKGIGEPGESGILDSKEFRGMFSKGEFFRRVYTITSDMALTISQRFGYPIDMKRQNLRFTPSS